MNDDSSWPRLYFGTFVVGVLLFIVVVVTASDRVSTAYRQGQIDAANGIMKYQLQPNPDGSTSWVQKPDESGKERQ